MNRIPAPGAQCISGDLRQHLTAAFRGALAAGQLLKKGNDNPHEITMKGVVNLMTEVNPAAEAAIVASNRTLHPSLLQLLQ